MATGLEIQQSTEYQGDNWWKWAVWIEGSDQDLNAIDHVEWTLHPTFPNPIRTSRDRARKFIIETGGWGTFQLHAEVHMNDGTSRRLSHYLKLYSPGGH